MVTIRELLASMIEKINEKVRTINGVEPDERGNVEIAVTTPDWNASEGEVGYIENRTHYEHIGATLLPETEVVFSEDGFGSITPAFEIVYGQQYRITVNGEVVIAAGAVADGLPAIYGTSQVSGLFGILNVGNNVIFAWMNEVIPTVISVEEYTIQKIPEKYLPDSMRNYIVKVTQEEWDTRDTSESMVTMNQLWDSIVDILYAGGDVWLDLSGIEDDQKWYTPGYAKVSSWAISPDGNRLKGGFVYAYINDGYRFKPYTFQFPGSQAGATSESTET